MTGPSERVVDAVAAHSNTPPLNLPPLYDTIDPDALDALFHANGMNGRVDFQYGNYNVTVRSSEEIELTPIEK